MKARRHSIDLLFSLSLFTVFVICAFLVLLFQVNGYHSIIDKGERLEHIHTPLAYVQTQIRAHDELGAVELFEEQGISGLYMKDAASKSALYIYEQDHKLKELRVYEQVEPEFTLGDTMFEIKEFKIKKTASTFEIKLVSSDGIEQTLQIPYRCM